MAVNKPASEYGKDFRHNSAFLVVTEIRPTVIDDLEHEIPDLQWHLDIDFDEKILVIETMPSKPHETACAGFDYLLHDKFSQMDTRIYATRTAQISHGKFVKDPDLSWTPVLHRTWPTLVVEVGFSETHAKLAIDAQAWLEGSQSGVNTVVTVDLDQRRPVITIERWERSRPTDEHSIRSWKEQSMAGVDRRVTISHAFGVTTASGGLSIPFEAVIERRPQGNEGDLFFSVPELMNFAEVVWGSQQLL